MVQTIAQILNIYEIGRKIGDGAFSEVREGRKRDTNQPVAIKIIDKSKCVGKESMIQTEVAILRRVKHPNIVPLYEVFETRTNILLVMELVTGGELFDAIVKKGYYTEADSASIMHSILHAISYLHKKGIAHRDLKPENLLYQHEKGPIMISDFGLSKIFSENDMMKTACGTPGYVAPEVLKKVGYGKEVDMWSIGVITFILLCGYPPFFHDKQVELFRIICRGSYSFDSPYWDKISPEAKDFVSKLLVVDPQKRMMTKAALKHPFIVAHCGYAEDTILEEPELTTHSRKASLTETNIASSVVGELKKTMLESKNSRSSIADLTAALDIATDISEASRTAAPVITPVTATADVSRTPSNRSRSPSPRRYAEIEDTADAAPEPKPLKAKEDKTSVEVSDSISLTAINNSTQLATSSGNISEGKLRFMSLNLLLLPPGLNSTVTNLHKDARLKHFIEQELNNYDIISLQDVYAYGSARLGRLVHAARKIGFAWWVTSPQKGLLSSGNVDGGLLVISRIPIVSCEKLEFTQGIKSSARGALYCRLSPQAGQFIHLFNTRLTASSTFGSLPASDTSVRVRHSQLSELRSFIHTQIQKCPQWPVLLSGDFSINARSGGSSSEEYTQMMQLLKGQGDKEHSEVSPINFVDLLFSQHGEHPVTYGAIDSEHGNPVEKHLTPKHLLGCCASIDYVFFASGKETKMKNMNAEVKTLSVKEGMEFSHLSDHYGVYAEFDLGN